MQAYRGQIARVKVGCEGRCAEVHGAEVLIVDVYEDEDYGRTHYEVEFITDIYPPYIITGHRERRWRESELDFKPLDIIWEV
jgi:hypothetical protein